MRARLLDMGQIGPLRAYGLRLALAGALDQGSEPVVLVACAATPAVTLGEERDLPAEVDLEACAVSEVAVLRLPGASPAALVAEGALWVSLLLPAAAAAELELPASAGDCHAWMAGMLVAAGGPEAADSAVDIEATADGTILTARLGSGGGEQLRALLFRQSLSGEPDAVGQAAAMRSPAEAAEALLQELEQRLDLEMVPSMPTPEELDGVYQWERKLVAMAVQSTSPPAAAPV